MTRAPVIAIDGPSGSGKSTVARLLAKKLGYTYIDTGAMFRGLGIYFHQNKIDFSDDHGIEKSLSEIQFEYGKSEEELVLIDGKNVTQEIREHYVSDLASKVSKNTLVRKYLLQKQRDIGHHTKCVMEGRDIGTVIFPDAFLKVFLTAQEKTRAQRRFDELTVKGDNNIDFEKILNDIVERDHRDKTRVEAPLIQADDAILIETDLLSIQDIVDKIARFAKKKYTEVLDS